MAGRKRVEPVSPGEARRLLLDMLDALADLGDQTPCQRAPTFFTSDHAAERASAAAEWSACPLSGACGRYADSAGERWRVWGGRDRTSSEQSS